VVYLHGFITSALHEG